MRNLPLTSPPCAPATFGSEPNHPVMSIELVDDFDDHVEVIGAVGEGQGAVAREPAFGGRGEHPANRNGTSHVLLGYESIVHPSESILSPLLQRILILILINYHLGYK